MRTVPLVVALCALDIQMFIRMAFLGRFAMLSDPQVTLLTYTSLLHDSFTAAARFSLFRILIASVLILRCASVLGDDLRDFVFVAKLHRLTVSSDGGVSRTTHANLSTALDTSGRLLEDVIIRALSAERLGNLVALALSGPFAIISDSDVALLANTLLPTLGLTFNEHRPMLIALLAIRLGNLIGLTLLRTFTLFALHEVTRLANAYLVTPLPAVGMAFVTFRALSLHDGVCTTVLDGLTFVSNKLVSRFANALLLARLVAVRMASIAVLFALGLDNFMLSALQDLLASSIHHCQAGTTDTHLIASLLTTRVVIVTITAPDVDYFISSTLFNLFALLTHLGVTSFADAYLVTVWCAVRI